jgi:hypothetical protein
MEAEKKERAVAGQDDTEGPDDPKGSRADQPSRPACPRCGSAHTQPFTHAGPGGRVNMKCIDCGELFRHVARLV